MDEPTASQSEPRPAARPPSADPGLEATLAAFSDLRYRDDFWPSRRYEDQCDRIALRALLPPGGDILVDVGAGFGRLADEYGGYREPVLLDPSEQLLRAARERLGEGGPFRYVQGDAYRLPFDDGTVDAVVCIRVLHHIRDPRPAIDEFARVLRPGGVLILESANRRNLKSILGFVLRRHRSSPFARGSQPYQELTLIPRRAASNDEPTPGWTSSTSFKHAPTDLRAWLSSAGFVVSASRSVGLLRLGIVTRHAPVALLVGLERVLQPGLAPLTPGPSLVLRAVRSSSMRISEPAREPGGS